MTLALTAEEWLLRKQEDDTRSDYQITHQTALAHGCDPQAVRGPSRLQEHVEQRRRVARALRALGWSYPRIGRNLGNRNHTSIMYLCGAIHRMCKSGNVSHETESNT